MTSRPSAALTPRPSPARTSERNRIVPPGRGTFSDRDGPKPRRQGVAGCACGKHPAKFSFARARALLGRFLKLGRGANAPAILGRGP